MSDAGRGARTLALVGLRCVGKSSVGRELARLTGAVFEDLDEALVAQGRAAGHGPAGAGELLRQVGEPAFRALELDALRRLLDAPPPDSRPRVLATGGGVVETPAARGLLRAGALVVWLREDPDLLARRLAADGSLRPSLTGADPGVELAALAERRAPLYSEVAHLALDGRGDGIEALARRVLAELPPPWTRGA